MKTRIPVTYRAQQFAARAGVTVRTLHHYDQLGLLEPSGRSDAGYRLYREEDLARLEHIVVLKFLGLPLKQIKALLAHESSLAAMLQRQRRVLAARREQLTRAIAVIERAERSVQGGEDDWDLIADIVRELEMENSHDWTKQYYSPEAQAKVESRKNLWSPELQERVSKQWTDLIADVTSALGEDPAGPRAQALAARWQALVDEFTGGDAAIQEGLNRLWADKENWPASVSWKHTIDERVQEFITRALRARA